MTAVAGLVLDEGSTRHGGGWRQAFLHRDTPPRQRSLSRPRPARTGGASECAAVGDCFDQQAVLDQDRALIQQLTQRQPRREGSVVRKPPPPPKVTPYRSSGSNAALAGAAVDSAAITAVPAEERCQVSATEDAVGQVAENAAVGSSCAPLSNLTSPVANRANIAIVPQTGPLFTSTDIDCIMNHLGGAVADVATSDAGGVVLGSFTVQEAKDAGGCATQNFGDISAEFYRNHCIGVNGRGAIAECAGQETQRFAESMNKSGNVSEDHREMEIPQRNALREQINAMDSWLEDDFASREQLLKPSFAEVGKSTIGPFGAVSSSAGRQPIDIPKEIPLSYHHADSGDAEIITHLESFKRRKALGEKTSPVVLKNIAAKMKPLLPNMSLERLVHVLRLFTSARHEDHDLYLRILGEIPMQIRCATPELLTTCVRVLRRLRLPEATYLELFSMEAMNMIRSKRRMPSRAAPRRPPAPRSTDAAASLQVISGGAKAPLPPAHEIPAPFDSVQLIQFGNSLSYLGAKHPLRFLEVYQEQLALAIPRFTQEECELVSPTLAMSQLMPDALRRLFLERCAQVDAGGSPPSQRPVSEVAAPNIEEYQDAESVRRRRLKHFSNIFIIEASVRKETFSFFSSLPSDVRAYLDRLHVDSSKLLPNKPSTMTAQVAAVLDQLGVACDTTRMAGPLGLHVVAKATNPHADRSEIVYECSDACAFFVAREEDSGATPEMTAYTKLRHRLLQRMGIQLTKINIWEWQQLSDAQRINYIVKLQSLQ